MKKISVASLAIALLLCFGSADTAMSISRKKRKENVEQDVRRAEAMAYRFDQIKKAMIDRGYLKVDELEELLRQERRCWGEREGVGSTCVHVMWWSKDFRIKKNWTPHEVFETLCAAINKDYLPFKVMLYHSLEKEDFDEAEKIRMVWIDYLNRITKFLKEYRCNYYRETGKIMSVREYAYADDKFPRAMRIIDSRILYQDGDPDVLRLVKKVEGQIQKLTSVVGLTDPMLITLRKELMTAIEHKKWDDAQKIQNLITARVNELRPPQPQVVYKEVPSKGGDTTVVVQEPSEQTVKVKRSHGAEDFLKAGSLLSGKGYTSKELGAAKMIDMIFGW
ncbi:MAG: hypothetical protein JSV50_14305 [Desulfobacteraceae bacterium]|nr:MAG: hypothetical protein JSV50_14305 [Desulfobacteraceae bacterium]